MPDTPARRSVVPRILSLVRWYATPSGLVLGVGLAAAALAIVLEQPLLALLSVAAIGTMLPWKFARERRDARRLFHVLREDVRRNRARTASGPDALTAVEVTDARVDELEGGFGLFTEEVAAAIVRADAVMHRLEDALRRLDRSQDHTADVVDALQERLAALESEARDASEHLRQALSDLRDRAVAAGESVDARLTDVESTVSANRSDIQRVVEHGGGAVHVRRVVNALVAESSPPPRSLAASDEVHAVVVHQMGKVGSRSLYEALRDHLDGEVFHTHRLNPGLPFFVEDPEDVPPPTLHRAVPGHILTSRRVRHEYLDVGRTVGIITPVREPIGRNVSAFFENLHRYTRGTDIATDDPQALYELFRQEFPHDQPDTWFQAEFVETFDVDPFRRPFPASGVQSLIGDGARLLLLRSSQPDDEKIAAVCDFLDVQRFDMPSVNVTDESELAETYADFKALVGGDKRYIDDLLELRVARHFFDASERGRIRDRWLALGSE